MPYRNLIRGCCVDVIVFRRKQTTCATAASSAGDCRGCSRRIADTDVVVVIVVVVAIAVVAVVTGAGAVVVLLLLTVAGVAWL
jgi:hypothetical protein